MIAAYGMMLGDFKTSLYAQDDLLLSMLFITFMLVLPVVMMNVLIASMVSRPRYRARVLRCYAQTACVLCICVNVCAANIV